MRLEDGEVMRGDEAERRINKFIAMPDRLLVDHVCVLSTALAVKLGPRRALQMLQMGMQGILDAGDEIE